MKSIEPVARKEKKCGHLEHVRIEWKQSHQKHRNRPTTMKIKTQPKAHQPLAVVQFDQTLCFQLAKSIALYKRYFPILCVVHFEIDPSIRLVAVI